MRPARQSRLLVPILPPSTGFRRRSRVPAWHETGSSPRHRSSTPGPCPSSAQQVARALRDDGLSRQRRGRARALERYPEARGRYQDPVSLSMTFLHAAGTRRARSRSRLARPYIWRLRAFSLLIWPSVCPLDHGSRRAARTACLSAVRPRAWDARRAASGLTQPVTRCALCTPPDCR